MLLSDSFYTLGVDEIQVDVAGMRAAAVPSHLLGPLDWKPGLQEQKESVPFTTQWASSPSMHTVRLLRQSLCTLSARTESQDQSVSCEKDDKTADHDSGFATHLSYCSWFHPSRNPHSRWSSCSEGRGWCIGRWSRGTHPSGTRAWTVALERKKDETCLLSLSASSRFLTGSQLFDISWILYSIVII